MIINYLLIYTVMIFPNFNEIYNEYIEKICSFFKIVITYSIGENNIKDKRFVIIKIPE